LWIALSSRDEPLETETDLSRQFVRVWLQAVRIGAGVVAKPGAVQEVPLDLAIKIRIVDRVRSLRQERPEEDRVHVLGVVEQAVDGLHLAGSKSKMIVHPVVPRCPIDMNIGAAELSQLVHVQLDSDPQLVGEGIGETHRAIGPLQTASA